MLKIRNDVDLKELQKFGFKLDYELSTDIETIWSNKSSYQKLCFEDKTKIIFLYEGCFQSNTFLLKNDILYDLIQAGLVEKVSD